MKCHTSFLRKLNFHEHFRCLYSQQNLPFKIPEPINRSPTDLLQALSETVKNDPTASHYSFIDDPFTIPTGRLEMRNFFMAKEMGRRAARKLVEEWPTLFMFDRDHPRLSAFRPERPLDPQTIDPTEQNLQKMIHSRHVESALKLYQRMTEGQTKSLVSGTTMIDLFNLLCYYNGYDVQFDEMEEWHGSRNFINDKNVQTEWNQNNLVESLFEILPKTNETYSTLICGLLKHSTKYSKERAIELFSEMTNKNMLPHEEVFNLAIEKGVSLSKFDQSSGDTWINYMIKIGVRPSVHTYNALLRTIDLSTSVNYKQKIVRDTLAHMSSNKIQPDMTTYWLVLSAFDPNKQPTRQQENYKISLRPPINILSEILKKLESLLKNSNPLEISEPTDQEFFIQAMSIACRATNVSIADRIEKLYKSPQNRIRMTSFIKESEFYEYYLLLKLENSSPLDGLELYRTIIPGLVGLDSSLWINLCKIIRRMENWHFTHQLICDAINSKLINRYGIFGYVHKLLLLTTDIQKLLEPEQRQFREISLSVLNIWDELIHTPPRRLTDFKYQWRASSLIDSIILLLRIGETNKAIELLKTLFDEKFYEGEDAIISSGYLLQRQIDQLIASETLPPVWKEAIPSKFRDISEKLRIIESYPGGVRTRHSYRRNNRFNGL